MKIRILGIILCITIFCLNTTSITFANNTDNSRTNKNSDILNIENRMYIDNYSETVNIDGIDYTYDYFFKDGNRAINVTNTDTGHIDTIVYDESNLEILLNNSLLATVETTYSTTDEYFRSNDYWQDLGSTSHRITWKQGTTVSVVAAAFGVYLKAIGIPKIIATMGPSIISKIALSSIGGTLYIKTRKYAPPFGKILYEYTWTFRSSSYDIYGPYLYVVQM